MVPDVSQLPYDATNRRIVPLEPVNLVSGVCDVEGGGKHHARRENLREIDPRFQSKP
jgi:hypothetical protein